MSKQSITSKTFLGFFWSTGGKLINALAQIVVLAVLARLISPQDFGLVQAALIVVGFAQLISKMGIGPALVQRKDLSDNHIRVGFTFSLILGLFLGTLMFILSPFIASFFKIEGLTLVLKVVSLLFVLESFVTVSTSLIEKEMRFKERAIVEMLSYIFGYGVVGIVLGYLDYGYWALIYAIFAQQIIKMIAYQIIRKHSFKFMLKKQELKELLYFGGGFTIAKFFNYFANQADNIMVGRYLNAEALGLYSRAYTIMSKPVSLIGDSMDKALFPAMAHKQNDRNALIHGFISGSKLIIFVSIPIACLIYFSAEEIVLVLLGDNWLDAVPPLKILTITLYFKMGYKMGDNLCRATGNVYKRANRQFVFALAVILGTYFGVSYGIEGVAYGTLIAIILNYILMIGLSLKILNISWLYFIKNIIRDLPVLTILSISFVFLINTIRAFDFNPLLTLLLASGIFGIIALVLFYFFGHKLSFLKVLPFKKLINKFIRHTI